MTKKKKKKKSDLIVPYRDLHISYKDLQARCRYLESKLFNVRVELRRAKLLIKSIRGKHKK